MSKKSEKCKNENSKFRLKNKPEKETQKKISAGSKADARRAYLAKYRREMRQNMIATETPEERKARCFKRAAETRRKRKEQHAKETPEQASERRAKSAERIRRQRAQAKEKLASETPQQNKIRTHQIQEEEENKSAYLQILYTKRISISKNSEECKKESLKRRLKNEHKIERQEKIAAIEPVRKSSERHTALKLAEQTASNKEQEDTIDCTKQEAKDTPRQKKARTPAKGRDRMRRLRAERVVTERPEGRQSRLLQSNLAAQIRYRKRLSMISTEQPAGKPPSDWEEAIKIWYVQRYRNSLERRQARETPDETAIRRAKLAKNRREMRQKIIASETAEERKARCFKNAEETRRKRKEQRAKETPEQAAERRAKGAERVRRQRAQSKEKLAQQRGRNLAKQNERMSELPAERVALETRKRQRARETPEETATRRAKLAKYRREMRQKIIASETAEERKARCFKKAEETRRIRKEQQAKETPEQAAERRAKGAERVRRQRAQAKVAQNRDLKSAKQNERMTELPAERVALETQEGRQARETPEETATRRAKLAKYRREMRQKLIASETPEERKARCFKRAEQTRRKRKEQQAKETPAQAVERRAKLAEQTRRHRAKAKENRHAEKCEKYSKPQQEKLRSAHGVRVLATDGHMMDDTDGDFNASCTWSSFEPSEGSFSFITTTTDGGHIIDPTDLLMSAHYPFNEEIIVKNEASQDSMSCFDSSESTILNQRIFENNDWANEVDAKETSLSSPTPLNETLVEQAIIVKEEVDL